MSEIENNIKLFSEKDLTLEFLEYCTKDLAEEDELIYDSIFLYGKHQIEIIYKFAESIIEKVFLNSLLFMFLKNVPNFIFFTPPSNNINKDLRDYFEFSDEFTRFFNDFTKSDIYKEKGLKAFDGFLEYLIEIGDMEREEKSFYEVRFSFHKLYDIHNCYHVTLQPKFPNIIIDGKTIRADMLVWVPNYPEVKLIIECDGYKYHKERNSFITDRKRDRALKKEGFEVLRFSGSEINKKPAQTSIEVYDFLEKFWGDRPRKYKF